MTNPSARRRLPVGSPGDITTDPETGERVHCVAPGQWESWTPVPYSPFPLEPSPSVHQPVEQPLRIDEEDEWRPAYSDLEADEYAAVTAETPGDQRADGWTAARRRLFLERLSTTASVQEAARSVGMTRQSARKLYRRAPAFRAAWDEALRECVSVLAETAFHRAIHGTEQQVYHQGQLVGTREVHHDQLLMYLLRVRDPLNYAPIDELERWKRYRALPASAASGAAPPVLAAPTTCADGNAEGAATMETSETSRPARLQNGLATR
jgi:hypothetical protein